MTLVLNLALLYAPKIAAIVIWNLVFAKCVTNFSFLTKTSHANDVLTTVNLARPKQLAWIVTLDIKVRPVTRSAQIVRRTLSVASMMDIVLVDAKMALVVPCVIHRVI